ncbi:peptide-N(4)-(N-acetyl-beta-glucosaminyl)asparagine amidase-like isoform X1 [Gossypium australe]|uniref:Peptide-N(4)-(N-acetyl-beta-glucosaminyl)asparagine amidase-like isoform X1 n=1 Tax=Gossypium australe TaxID=47621 RepID=A0A5B6VV41_9ROSI|nr:peptide-N(4)-(N-acetyl-beta-glucosaminyl)asparagine amidase-like isoform X1 [Gossypium australe]
MVARKLLVRHDDSTFTVDYDTDDGFEVFQFLLYSLTSIPPDQQKKPEKQEEPTSSSAGAANFDSGTTVMRDVELAPKLQAKMVDNLKSKFWPGLAEFSCINGGQDEEGNGVLVLKIESESPSQMECMRLFES